MKQWLVIVLLCWCGMLSAQSYHIGDLYTAPDGSKGIVFHLHPDGTGGWVVALNNASTYCYWGDTLVDIVGLSNSDVDYVQQLLYDTAGYAHTQALRAEQPSSSNFAAWQVDFDNGWYLPAPGQLSILLGAWPFINSKIIAAGGTALGANVSNGYYWSSSEQSSSEAWAVCCFGTAFTGKIELKKKMGVNYGVRAVRSFTYSTVIPDTTLTYLWNTGSTDPSIGVSPAQTTTYTVTATTEFGCSNTAAQTIFVGGGGLQTIVDTICQGAGYEDNGFFLAPWETDVAGSLTRSRIVEALDCIDTVRLQLWVKPSKVTPLMQTACESYELNGITYYTTGVYLQNYSMANGCDSVVMLTLTVTYSPSLSVNVSSDSVCPGDSVTLQASAADLLFVPPVAIGDILCTDGTTVRPENYANSGKTAKGVVFYVDNTGSHGWAMRLHDEGSSSSNTMRWSLLTNDIELLPNADSARAALMDLNGFSNTQHIREAYEPSTIPAANAVDFANGWYLPAAGQLRLLCSEMVTLNASLAIVGGTQIPMDSDGTYWSSTENNQNKVWCVRFWGELFSNPKYYTCAVRSICNF